MNDLMAYLLLQQRLSPFPSYSAPLEAEGMEDTEDTDEEDIEAKNERKGVNAALEEPRLPGDIMGGIEMPDYPTTRRADDDDFWPSFFEHMNRFFPTAFEPPGGQPWQRPQQIIESEASEPIDVFSPVKRARQQAQLASAIGRGRRI
jgi:hypothetical protein